MNEPRQAAGAATSTSTPTSTGDLKATLFRAAWLAILLGIVMEILLLLIAAGFGIFPSLGLATADLVRQLSWSTFVCVGLALGTAVTKARAPLMGLLGLLAAPLAFNISRGLHQGAVKTLEIAGTGADATPVLLLALLKGVEYGCLGATLGWVGQRPWGGAGVHIAVGLAIGIVFGGAIVVLTYLSAPEPLATANVVSRSVNEILFPVGCSLVLFFATALGERSGD
jgi:hypothetical protein